MESVIDALRRPTSAAELHRLAVQVKTHAEMLDEESLSLPHIDYVLAQSVADVLCELIDGAQDLAPDDRSLLGAAAHYFVLTEDEASDLDVDGLVDDANAAREICDQLGRPDLADRLRDPGTHTPRS